MKKIYFLFPIFNESKRIINIISFFEWVSINFEKSSYEFVFLLNACTDNSEKIIKDEFSNYPIMIIKSNNKNRGSGLNNFYNKKIEGYYAICSIDNAWSFDFYTRAYQLLKDENYDIVYGPKSHIKSKVETNFKRKIISFFSRIFIKILFGKLINQDTQCIKFFKSNIKFLDQLHDYNYFTETEFYILSKIYESRICSISVYVKNDTKNSKVNLKSIYSYILECVDFKVKYLKKIK